MKYPTELVLQVNRAFHDIEAKQYTNHHTEIFFGEVDRWHRIGREFISNNPDKIRFLDVGSGTGFVPLQIAPFLKEGDLLVCLDVSANMLQICRTNVEEKFSLSTGYLMTDGNGISLKSNSLNYITLNSVLHHIPDIPSFFTEVNRLMKKGGLLIIAHEPHKLFFQHIFLWNNYRLIHKAVRITPKRLFRFVMRKIRLSSELPQRPPPNQEMIKKVNRRLLAEKSIDIPLTATEIAEIVDIHSPTAGRGHRERGIDISEILECCLSNFELVHLETYRHLAKVTSKNRFTKWYDGVLKKIYPEMGSTFLIVLRKNIL